MTCVGRMSTLWAFCMVIDVYLHLQVVYSIVIEASWPVEGDSSLFMLTWKLNDLCRLYVYVMGILHGH